MSNPCRRFHTTFGRGGSKVLIRLVADAVAEGRQATGHDTRAGADPGLDEQDRDESLLRQRHAGQADEGREKTIQASVKPAENAPATWSKRRRGRVRKLANNAFDNAYCRSFSTLHRVPGLFYTPPEISLRFGMQGARKAAGAGQNIRGLGCRALRNGHSVVCDGVNGKRPDSQST